jgi:hypothetical protein
MEKHQIEEASIDEAVLGLMFLSLHDDRSLPGLSRAWKSFDWNSLDRLQSKGLILDPKSKAKSVVLTDEGRKRSEAAFHRLFVRKTS